MAVLLPDSKAFDDCIINGILKFGWALKFNVFPEIHMRAAGLEYIDGNDTVHCKECNLKISKLTLDMHPFDIHSDQKPDCPFIQSTRKASSLIIASRDTSTSNKHENSSKRQKVEINLTEQRRRSFLGCFDCAAVSSEQMVQAGFFNCNVRDRVICLSCNLICQQWTPTDDPYEVHKAVSPNCPYVKGNRINPSVTSITTADESSTETMRSNHSPTSANIESLPSDETKFTAACNPSYAELSKRHASFATWPQEKLSLVDDLVRAGFFCTGTDSIVTCFYCNGSLQNWGPNDNPTIEHARRFPHCTYARHLCIEDMFRKRQEPEDSQQDRNSELSIIWQCWDDQRRIKRNFVSEYDLYVACLIRQKQNEHLDGKKENIVIPRFRMKDIRDGNIEIEKQINFKEERSMTIEREQSFKEWPHSCPSRIMMLIAGWSLDTTKGKDFVTCPHCGVECTDWKANDDPLIIHRGWARSCPYILAEHPIHPSSVAVKAVGEVYTEERIAEEASKPMPNILLPSPSSYAQMSKRLESFSSFPGGQPNNANALAASGFYSVGKHTLLQCYWCGEFVKDFHQYPSQEINIRHRDRSNRCRLAQMLCNEVGTNSTTYTERCRWCSAEPRELAIDSCNHLAVCKRCAERINTCPICGENAEAFFRIYM